MNSLAHLFGWGGSPKSTTVELADMFPIPIAQNAFVEVDVQTIFRRILTAVLERTDGIPSEAQPLLWDNCVASETSDGLVSLLAKAMSHRSDLFLVYDKALKIIRKAESSEASQIRADYKAKGESAIGVYVTFKNFTIADMVRFYSALEYCAIGGLWKQSNLSKALQFKAKDLRKSVGAVDAESIIQQAIAIAEALSKGKNVLIDGEDILELLKIDVAPTQATIDFITKKLSLYLGLPASWITGESKNSMGDTGEGDTKKVEAGLRVYFLEIIKPVCEKLFNVTLTFKSEDFRSLSTALDALRTFETTSEEFMSAESKTGLTNKLFGLPNDAKGDPTPRVTTSQNAPQLNPPAQA